MNAMDANERVALLRAMAAAFPDEADAQPLTESEIRLARGTSLKALEQAAVLAEAVPEVGHVIDTGAIRDAIAFDLAYGGVRDAARVLARQADLAILRRKWKAARVAHALLRMGRAYITLDRGDAARPHVAELRRLLIRPRRKPSPSPSSRTAGSPAR